MSSSILDRVLKSPRLPTLPAVAIEVIALVEDPDVDINHLADTISHDPALTAKILKTVNSSFYGQSKEVSTISQAVVVLGLNSLKTLALGFSLVNNLNKPHGDGFDHDAFWKRSLFSAVAARKIAERIRLLEKEEAFLGGLLQDLGVLALDQVLGEKYQQILAKVDVQHRKLRLVEQKCLTTDHTEIGAALAEKWHLPQPMLQCIRWHEEPDRAEADTAQLVRCVAIGNFIADVFMHDEAGEPFAELLEATEAWFGFDAQTTRGLIAEMTRDANEVKRLFDLPIDELESADAMLARANEALMQINLQIQHQSSQLEQQNRQLAQRATTDPLTGLFNRGHLDETLQKQFDDAQRMSTPLSVLMMDTDHFKQFNDTYGHQTGDRVLQTQGNLLKSVVLEPAMPARYGGEEFVLLLPGFDADQAGAFAEKVRTMISMMPVQSNEGKPLSVTVSIGVATFEGSNFAGAEQLLKAADDAVYAAKDAGRDCVRIYDTATNQTVPFGAAA